jgi:hypothetical protein
MDATDPDDLEPAIRRFLGMARKTYDILAESQVAARSVEKVVEFRRSGTPEPYDVSHRLPRRHPTRRER